MTALPTVRGVESQALFVARQWFEHWHDRRDSDPLTDVMMTPAASSVWVRHVMRLSVIGSLGSRLSVITAARQGDPDAIAVVQEAISALHARGAALPAEIAAYAMDRDAGLLHHLQRHGPVKHARMTRNWLIMIAVAMLVDHFGLPATRNTRDRGRPSSRLSACAIVAEAYGLIGEKGVEKIWARVGRVGAPTVPGWSGPLFDLVRPIAAGE